MLPCAKLHLKKEILKASQETCAAVLKIVQNNVVYSSDPIDFDDVPCRILKQIWTLFPDGPSETDQNNHETEITMAKNHFGQWNDSIKTQRQYTKDVRFILDCDKQQWNMISKNPADIKQTYTGLEFLECLSRLHQREEHVRVCRSPPLLVKSSHHNGDRIGRGVFALIPFFRGQYLMQFEGSIARGNITTQQNRLYALAFQYMSEWYTVDPMHTVRTSYNYETAGFVNEPSTVQFATGDVLWFDRDFTIYGRFVKKSKCRKNMFVKFANGKDLIEMSIKQVCATPQSCFFDIKHFNANWGGNRVHHSVVLTHKCNYDVVIQTKNDSFVLEYGSADIWKPDLKIYVVQDDICFINSRVIDHAVLTSNCSFFDCPIPLEFYHPFAYKGKRVTCRFKNPSNNAACVTVPLAIVCNLFKEAYTDTTQQNLTKQNVARLSPKMYLRFFDDCFAGLYRNAKIMSISHNKLTFECYITSAVFWSIPNIIKASYVDDHKQLIPYPFIYAIDDIKAGSELLVMYSDKSDKNRGVLPDILNTMEDIATKVAFKPCSINNISSVL